MERTVTIEGRDIVLKVHGNIPNMYEAQFGKDIFVEMNTMHSTGNISMGLFSNFLWVCAKAADKEILPPDEWFASFDSSPVLHCFEEVQELFEKLLPMGKLTKPKVKAKAKR